MPNSTIVGYARVSSVDQNLDRQLVQLKAENVEKLFIDKVSGKNLDRPGFSAMMEYVREGDVWECAKFSVWEKFIGGAKRFAPLLF